MIRKDYFLRMIHQLARVLAKVLKLEAEERYDDALAEVGQSSKQLLGVGLPMLTTLSDAELIRLMSLGDRFDVEKCMAAAEFLRMVGELKALQGNEAASHLCSVTSLSLFLELLSRETDVLPEEYSNMVEDLIQTVSDHQLPLPLRQKLFRYYEYKGRFDLAENILSEVIEEESSFVAEGVRFYERLRLKSDEQLQRGNLPRNEVEDGIKTLEQQLK